MPSMAGRLTIVVAWVLTAALVPAWDPPQNRLATVALTATAAPPNWVAGDAHVHAAGDSGLEPHVRCRDTNGGLAGCAEHLVREILQRAKDNGTAWVILTEHGPWLGTKPTDRTFCAPPFGWPCKTIPWVEHDAEQARRQYLSIRAAARKLAPEYGVRALMGQELGTAGHITLLVSYLEHAPSQLKDWYPGDCDGVEAGHFGVYYTPELLPDTAFDCNESTYLQNAAAAGAWGAVNHPDNEDGGSRWFCWNAGDVSPKDNIVGRDAGGGSRCTTGVYEKPGVVQAIELTSDQNMPSDVALRHLDALLLQGRRVSLTGGGDSHTAKPEPSVDNGVRIGSLRIPLPPSVSQEPGNDAKVGLSGRTYIPADGLAMGTSFDPIDRDDPVRKAIKEGRTVASTGPLGLPTIGGSVPGDTIDVVDGSVRLRVDFQEARVVDGAVAGPGERQRTRVVPVNGSEDSGQVSRINVVIGRTGACPPVRAAAETACVTNPDNRRVTRHEVSATEREQGYAEITVPVPRNLSHGYLRTETLFSPTERDERFQGAKAYAHGAFASPFYLRQTVIGAQFVGTWKSRTRTATINADGTADIGWRDFSQEGMVFITVKARLEAAGTGLRGTVTVSDSAKVPVGTPVRVSPPERHIIIIEVGSESVLVCSPQAPPGYCG